MNGPACGDGRGAAIGIGAIAALALLVRLAHLRPDSTFQRLDEVMFILSSLKLHALVAPADLGEAARELFWMFAFPWGYPVIVVTWAWLELVGVLGLAIREFTVIAPFAVLGGLAPVLVFRLGRRTFSAAVGLAAAATVAVLPSHVAQSRTIAAWILATNLMMVVVLTFLDYIEDRRPRYAWRFGAALAAYLPSDNLAPGMLAFVGLQTLAATPGPLGARLAAAWSLLGRREVLLLPAFTVLPLVVEHALFVATGRGTYGFIGHYFLDKAAPGLHVRHAVEGLAANAGPALMPLLVVGAARALVSLFRRDRALPLALWLVSFALPTMLFINPGGTVVQGYLTPMMIPLLVLASGALFETAQRLAGARPAVARAAPAAVLALLVAWTLASLPARIWGRDFLGFRADPIGLWGGEVHTNDGAKTAGYYVRTETPPTAVVLSDVWSFCGKYYFHRRTLMLAESPRPAPPAGVDVLVLADRLHTRVDTDGYHLAATVTHRGRALRHVYTREPRTPRVLPTEDFDARFDREFGRVATLRYPVVWGD